MTVDRGIRFGVVVHRDFRVFTVAEAAVTSGVVMKVPHWLTWTGAVLVSQTLR